MVLIAILSGLINLSAQTVFQKVVSMTAGDLYTTYTIVVLTFIVGSGIGAFYSYLIRPWLHWIELLAGCYTFFVGFLLSGPFFQYEIPLCVVAAGLALPALALGTHIPLYSYYLRQLRFGLLYCFYHFGAVLGLIAFEWHFVHAGSIKGALYFTGTVQLTLGALLIHLNRQGRFHIDKISKSYSVVEWLKLFPKSVLSVFIASTISYYGVIWAFRTQALITDAFRLQATVISSAVFFWMALAGILSKKTNGTTGKIFLGMGISYSLIYLGFPHVSLTMTSLFNGNLANYFAISFLLALYLTTPVLFSSLVFITETRVMQRQLPVDAASGGLNLFASLGNLLGFAFSGLLAAHFWNPLYMLLASGSCFLLFITLQYPSKMARSRLAGSGLIVFLLLLAMSMVDLTSTMFLNHVSPEARATERIENIFISADAFSTLATFDIASDDEARPAQKLYLVDGHLSHNLESSAEFLVGLLPAMYFDKPLKKSMVIGLGSGQTSWAVAAISKQTELIEISQSVQRNLSLLKNFNFDLITKENVKIIMKDGFSSVRICPPKSYDLIVNTSTYPSNHGAGKLYSDEMIEFVENCLTSEGVYVTYFDGSTVNDLTDFYEFVYPIMRHFRHLDISLEPYPVLFAYNTPRNLRPLSAKSFVSESDFIQFNEKYPNVLAQPCRNFLRHLPAPAYQPLLTTLDNSYLERNSLRLSIQSKNVNHSPKSFTEVYNSPSSIPVYSCE